MSDYDIEACAKAFINDIIQLQRQHGLTAAVPNEAYERAVTQAASAFGRINPTIGNGNGRSGAQQDSEDPRGRQRVSSS